MLQSIYAVVNQEQFTAYQAFSDRFSPKIEGYINFLQERYTVSDLPGAIIWTGKEIATEFLSQIPIPAYTNEFRIVFCPEKDVWRDIYRSQWGDQAISQDISRYYDSLTERNVLQILGHELAHQSPLFEDSYEEPGCGPWFEEGMVEYISRQFFLQPSEFEQEAYVNRLLVERYEASHGRLPLEQFTQARYQQGLDTVFYWYWRSYLAISKLVEHFGGNEMAVFQAYRDWKDNAAQEPLSVWLLTQIPISGTL